MIKRKNIGRKVRVHTRSQRERESERKREVTCRGEGAKRERRVKPADRGIRAAAAAAAAAQRSAKRKQEGDRHLALLLSLGFGPILKWSRLSVNNLLCPGHPSTAVPLFCRSWPDRSAPLRCTLNPLLATPSSSSLQRRRAAVSRPQSGVSRELARHTSWGPKYAQDAGGECWRDDSVLRAQ